MLERRMRCLPTLTVTLKSTIMHRTLTKIETLTGGTEIQASFLI